MLLWTGQSREKLLVLNQLHGAMKVHTLNCKCKSHVHLHDADHRESLALFEPSSLFLLFCTCTKISETGSKYQYLFISSKVVAMLQSKPFKKSYAQFCGVKAIVRI